MGKTRESISASTGGIISLAVFVEEHREAVEYDLLTLTGHELADVGGTLSWGALASFLACVGKGSAIDRELHEEEAQWNDTIKTNGILADIYDMMAQINANLVALGERRKANEPKRYPRPGVEPDNIKHYGADPLPPDDLEAWFRMKRAGHGRRT